jgi:ADP-ribose pyrophosphatase YjhB (NUDIX family)
VIKNNLEQILCVREGENDYWDLPGGGLNHGEGLHGGLVRELREEIGAIESFSEELLGVESVYLEVPQIWNLVIVFRVKLLNKPTIYVGPNAARVQFLNPSKFIRSWRSNGKGWPVEKYLKANTSTNNQYENRFQKKRINTMEGPDLRRSF